MGTVTAYKIEFKDSRTMEYHVTKIEYMTGKVVMLNVFDALAGNLRNI